MILILYLFLKTKKDFKKNKLEQKLFINISYTKCNLSSNN